MSFFTKNKFRLIIVFLLGAFIVGFIFIRQRGQQYNGAGLWPNYRIEHFPLENRTFRLVLAENPRQWTQGLMYVRKPTIEFDGMMFVFPDKQPRLFWNQNTFEDITIYWMADGRIIGKSELPSIEKSKKIVTVESPKPADRVIEIIK